MASRDGFGRVREYTDDPGYQGTAYGNFNELYDSVSSNIFSLNNNATSLDRVLKQIGTDKDCVQLRNRIHDTEQSNNRLINETASQFHQLAKASRRGDRSQKLQYERLMNEFKDAVQRYNTLQKRVAEKVKTAVMLSSQPKRESKGSDLIGWGEADDNDYLEQEQRRTQLQAQDQIVDDDLQFIQEREEQIRQLESDILDINEIFRDLGTLVHEQGEVIDTIEANVESAHGHVESGNEQLQKAAMYQRKARKKMCCLLLIFLVVGGIIALIIVLSVKT